MGLGYWKLVEEAEKAGVPKGKRNDIAIVLAAVGLGGVWLGCDGWAAVFALNFALERNRNEG